MEVEKPKSFIEELQELDESVKRKILTVATVVIMVAVAYIWIGYFNGLVAASGSGQATAASESAEPTTGGGSTNNGNSFWQDMKNDMANIANTMRGPGQYTITPQ